MRHNPLHSSVAFRTLCLICNINQTTGFYAKWRTGLKWTNPLSYFSQSYKTWKLSSLRSLLWPSLKTVSLLLILNECAKFLGSCAIVGLEGLVPVCHLAFVGILWVHIFFANVFNESIFFSQMYLVSPKFVYVGISWVQNFFSLVFRGSKNCPFKQFVDPNFFSLGYFISLKFYLVDVLSPK